jgi:hypothetical protein
VLYLLIKFLEAVFLDLQPHHGMLI